MSRVMNPMASSMAMGDVSPLRQLFVNEKALSTAGRTSFHEQEPAPQLACLYQPLDEIRDYFGDLGGVGGSADPQSPSALTPMA
eukprot:COSAG04_NODE_9495_length_858_cov_3.088274_1_plen_84_part_00